MTEQVIAEIRAEREYQEKKWGNDFDDTHTPADWWTFITFYFGRALKSWKVDKSDPFKVDKIQLRAGLVKVAALIVAWIEAIDRS